MATKSKAVSNSSMFGEVEAIPKRVGNFSGRKTDQKKIDFLNELFTSFAQFANANDLSEGQQVPVNELGGYSVTALEQTGNAMLKTQEAGFYLVGTDRPKSEDDEGKIIYGAPQKLVIRTGQRPTRSRNGASAE